MHNSSQSCCILINSEAPLGALLSFRGLFSVEAESPMCFEPASTPRTTGCTEDETECYSYIDISVLIGLLLSSGAIDFIVTGCSSGQGMMLACNSIPGVICGYAPTPKDAYLFAQINNGNAISLPLGEEYTWGGFENFDKTIQALFSEPFGQGYPKSEAARKLKDSEKLKEIRKLGQVSISDLLNRLDPGLLDIIKKKQDEWTRGTGLLVQKSWNICKVDH